MCAELLLTKNIVESGKVVDETCSEDLQMCKPVRVIPVALEKTWSMPVVPTLKWTEIVTRLHQHSQHILQSEPEAFLAKPMFATKTLSTV